MLKCDCPKQSSVSLIGCVIYLFYRLQDDPPIGVSGASTENSIMVWNAVIFG